MGHRLLPVAPEEKRCKETTKNESWLTGELRIRHCILQKGHKELHKAPVAVYGSLGYIEW